MRIVIDAMGGDNAPGEIVKGSLNALQASDRFELEIIGDMALIKPLIPEEIQSNNRLILTHTSEVISNDDKPTEAIKQKIDSSLVVGLNKIKDKSGQVFISAGSTGALLAGSLLIPGRIKGVNRPALAPIVPSASGGTMIIDAGMNTLIKPLNYLQFGIMGATYMKQVRGIENPRVGLINVGTEAIKGHAAIREAYELLSSSNLNFVGNIEGRDIADGTVDVAVCDGFTGNAMLKMMEGTGKFFLNYLKAMYQKNIFTMLSAMLVRFELRKFKKSLDPEEIGGVPLLGIDGMVYKCHGNSKAKAITNTILNSCASASAGMVDEFKNTFRKDTREEMNEPEV